MTAYFSKETDLILAAASLISGVSILSDSERNLLTKISGLSEERGGTKQIEAFPSVAAISTRNETLKAEDGKVTSIAEVDLLGETFCKLRPPDKRRTMGQVFTPQEIVAAMISRAISEQGGSFSTVIDCGAGTGRFSVAAGKAFPDAEIIAIEQDPACAILLRANLQMAGLTGRTRVIVGDYREFELGQTRGRGLFIGNPPYVRHHNVSLSWKNWYAETMTKLGAERPSRLAGLHLHFFAKTAELAKDGDLGIFVTSAEWLATTYGQALRTALCGTMGGESIHVVDAGRNPFPGVMTTAAVTVFRPHHEPKEIRIQSILENNDFGALEKGIPVPTSVLSRQKKWNTSLLEPTFPITTIPITTRPSGNAIRVGDVFRVSRGQVTGANDIWIVGETTPDLPNKFLKPCITRAREIFAAINDGGRLNGDDHLKRVVDLPQKIENINEEELRKIQVFIEWARNMGGDNSYIARHRNPWWAVKLMTPAPIICTYMARRPPAFVRNLVGARLLNIAHGLYPRAQMSEGELDEFCRKLNNAADIKDGRVYAGGLIKFEPGTIEDMVI